MKYFEWLENDWRNVKIHTHKNIAIFYLHFRSEQKKNAQRVVHMKWPNVLPWFTIRFHQCQYNFIPLIHKLFALIFCNRLYFIFSMCIVCCSEWIGSTMQFCWVIKRSERGMVWCWFVRNLHLFFFFFRVFNLMQITESDWLLMFFMALCKYSIWNNENPNKNTIIWKLLKLAIIIEAYIDEFMYVGGVFFCFYSMFACGFSNNLPIVLQRSQARFDGLSNRTSMQERRE